MAFRIAFIGATGMVGRPVAKELAYAGMEVTALVRDPSRAKDLTPAIAVMQGDLRNPEDLSRLFTGKDAVYLNLNLDMSAGKNSYHNEREGLDAIIAAARKHSLKRIAFVSSLVMNYQGMNGFNWWVLELKRQAVEKIRASGIPYTIFYPSTFMENFETNYRQGKKIMLAGTSHHKMYYIAGEDFGKQVSRSFQILSDENKEYTVQGPEGFTADEAATEYIRYYRKETLSISRAPAGVLKFLGYFNQRMHYGYHIVTALNHYPEKFGSQTTWDELGKPSITLKAFAGRSQA
jgi:uncharacterized protein YbjT (DUF2867 family)